MSRYSGLSDEELLLRYIRHTHGTPYRPPAHHAAQNAFWSNPARFRLFAGGIGSGKTLAGCYEALSQPAGHGAIIAPTYPMLRDATLRTFLDVARSHGRLRGLNKSDMVVTLTDGSTVLLRTADDPDRLRGPNLGWFYLDEAALMDPETWKIMIGRLREQPGRAWATTTPRGFDWLFDLFSQSDDPDYWMVTSSTRANPFLPDGFIPSLEAVYDDYWRAQEIEGRFIAFSQHAVFDVPYLTALLSTLPAPVQTYQCGENGLCGVLEVWERQESGIEYVIGVDVAEGIKKTGTDESAADVFRKDTGEQVASYYGKPDPRNFSIDLRDLSYTYNNAELIVENNSVGMVVIAYLEDEGANLWYGAKGKGAITPADGQSAGWRTTERSKQLADQELRVALVEAGRGNATITLRSRRCVEQCMHYVYLESGGRGGEGTWHDDHVRSVALANYRLKEAREAEDMVRGYTPAPYVPAYQPEYSTQRLLRI